MKRTKTIRRTEKLAMLLLPATCVLAAYSVFFAWPLAVWHSNAVQELRKAESLAVPSSEAMMAKEQLEFARQNIARLKTRILDGRTRIEELSQNWRDTENQLDTIQQVTVFLHAHQLSVVSQKFLPAPEMSAYDQKLVQIMNTHSPDKPLEFWEVEVNGAFPDIASFLSAVNADSVHIIPLAITMNESSESPGGIMKWNVLFLI